MKYRGTAARWRCRRRRGQREQASGEVERLARHARGLHGVDALVLAAGVDQLGDGVELRVQGGVLDPDDQGVAVGLEDVAVSTVRWSCTSSSTMRAWRARATLRRLQDAITHHRLHLHLEQGEAGWAPRALDGRASGTPVQFEWTLLDGVNDRDGDIDALCGLQQGARGLVNFILWRGTPSCNPHFGLR